MLIIKNLHNTNLAERALEDVGIITNRQLLQSDHKIPSGIRLGTPFVTSQGYSEERCQMVANQICDVLLQNEMFKK